ncbi:hypothetical protein [Terricaulis silvestris]|uniref:Uncharacterized protein n=1 Tax=Terricaulis silvestris TaxID=2686094 RepID=A0A6I6MWI3_9CAUL|nr:hypothetical protein [Terricaulis silvestris]QGZ95982.1 hypothetical protein DSM104635_02838 [Terricaulis silvestris]
MRSPRGFTGALVLLLGVPATIAVGALGGSVEIAIHIALGVSFLLFASATFDFPLPRPITWIACAAIGLLGAIFLLQAISEGVRSPALHNLAFDILGQRLEKVLGYTFLVWCAAAVVMDSSGWRRVLGAVALAATFCAESYALYAASTGQQASEALKLIYLAVFVWLLIESARKREAKSPPA